MKPKIIYAINSNLSYTFYESNVIFIENKQSLLSFI